MRIYPVDRHYIAGFLTATAIFSVGLYMFREGISRIPPVIRVTTNLEFDGCDGSKEVAWILHLKKPYLGEFRKKCIGE